MLKCDAYADITDDLVAHIRTIHPNFNNLPHSNKLILVCYCIVSMHDVSLIKKQIKTHKKDI